MLILSVQSTFAQAAKPSSKQIHVEHADNFERNEALAPGAVLLSGNVKVDHDGIVLTCNKAYIFEGENYLKAFGNVQLVQGDTLFLNSKYAEYSGNLKQDFATGDADLRPWAQAPAAADDGGRPAPHPDPGRVKGGGRCQGGGRDQHQGRKGALHRRSVRSLRRPAGRAAPRKLCLRAGRARHRVRLWRPHAGIPPPAPRAISKQSSNPPTNNSPGAPT